MTSPLVRTAFATIVVATIAAFFITQQLKGEFPLVLRFAATPNSISPNGDGVRDDTILGFDLSERAKVSFSVVDSEGSEVRHLVDNRSLAGDTKHRFTWNGRDDEGRRVPDGRYHLRLIRRDEGRVINSIKTIRVDTKKPRVRLTSASPGVISPEDRRALVRIRYSGPRNEEPEFRIFRTDEGAPRVVARFRGNDRREALWHGSVRGRPAEDGDYTFTVTVRDKAGNLSVAPTEIPTQESARRGTGVAVRHLTLRGPLTAVKAGSLVRLEAGPYRRSFEFALSRLGAKRAVKRDRRSGGAFRVRVPKGSRTGLYYVRVRSAGHRAVWPLAVQGRSRGKPGRRPLVVLPAITWEGLNRVDDDLDGFADTLATTRSVPLERPFARGLLPRELTSQAAPLIRFLDGKRLPYDLTTDVSLDPKRLPHAIALAGSERWLPAATQTAVRSHVEKGGRVASFGGDALRRSVDLRGGRLANPTAPSRENSLGERTRLVREERAPLQTQEDELNVFAGAGFIGEFTLFDLSGGLTSAARLVSSAGPGTDRRAFVAYRLGKGLVIRAGTPQWSSQLGDDALGRSTDSIWSVIGSG